MRTTFKLTGSVIAVLLSVGVAMPVAAHATSSTQNARLAREAALFRLSSSLVGAPSRFREGPPGIGKWKSYDYTAQNLNGHGGRFLSYTVETGFPSFAAADAASLQDEAYFDHSFNGGIPQVFAWPQQAWMVYEYGSDGSTEERVGMSMGKDTFHFVLTAPYRFDRAWLPDRAVAIYHALEGKVDASGIPSH